MTDKRTRTYQHPHSTEIRTVGPEEFDWYKKQPALVPHRADQEARGVPAVAAAGPRPRSPRPDRLRIAWGTSVPTRRGPPPMCRGGGPLYVASVRAAA